MGLQQFDIPITEPHPERPPAAVPNLPIVHRRDTRIIAPRDD